ncbi:ABC transporter permease [Streptomyces sp. NPDC059467]|uniref:ABC transporter permease n=1 Tax=Streptomyces sp. NPDC059467 TaxID=3346844 RepID=UPI0036A8FA11
MFGRRVRAIGGNERVATLAGVPTRSVKVLTFTLCGLAAGIGGVILAARLGTGSPVAGQGFELDVIAAVVIGGTPLTGGLGRITGTIVGALIISMLSNGLVLIGVGSVEQQGGCMFRGCAAGRVVTGWGASQGRHGLRDHCGV